MGPPGIRRRARRQARDGPVGTVGAHPDRPRGIAARLPSFGSYGRRGTRSAESWTCRRGASCRHGDHRGQRGRFPSARAAHADRRVRGRQARRHEHEWLAAITRARTSADGELPDATSGAIPNGPPPAHRWAERDPAAAARLGAARAVVTAIAEAGRLPAENLLSPDVLRRLSWDPPQPSDPVTVGEALASDEPRARQVQLTAHGIAEVFNAGKSNAGRGRHHGRGEIPDAGDTGRGRHRAWKLWRARTSTACAARFLNRRVGTARGRGDWAVALMPRLENIGVLIDPRRNLEGWNITSSKLLRIVVRLVEVVLELVDVPF